MPKYETETYKFICEKIEIIQENADMEMMYSKAHAKLMAKLEVLKQLKFAMEAFGEAYKD